MASPFSIFRRNQKVLITVLGVMAMFAFVFIPMIMQWMGGGVTNNPVVVKTTKFGNLTRYNVDVLRRNHLKVLEVLSQLAARGAKAEIDAYLAAGKISQEDAVYAERRYSPENYRNFYEKNFGQATPTNVVDRWLLARQAERSGMVVDNVAVRDFLRDITKNLVKPEEIQSVFDHADVGALRFISILRDVLLVSQFQDQFKLGTNLLATTPGQRWDYYNRLKRKAAIEAIPVAIAGFVKQVTDPTEAELKKFFEENKTRYPSPDSPEPGFRKPHKIALEYFRADYDKFASPKTITDTEIQQQYEKHKDLYDSFIERSSEKTPAEKTEQKPADKTEQKPAGKTDNKPADKSHQAPAEKTEQKPAGKTDSKPAAPKAEPKKDAKGASSRVAPISSAEDAPIILAALTQDNAQDNKKPAGKKQDGLDGQQVQKADQKTQPTAKTADPAKTPDGKQPEANVKGQQPAGKTPLGSAEKPSAPPKTDPSLSSGLSGGAGLPAPPKPYLSPVVREIIRLGIAQERIAKAFGQIREQMDAYYQEWSKYDAAVARQGKNALEQPLGSPPPRLDFEKLAKAAGLSTGHTNLMSAWEVQDLEIGLSQLADFQEGLLRSTGRGLVCRYAFQSLLVFHPEISEDIDGVYLFWKTEDEKEHVPQFTDDGVRDEVLRSRKMIHARSLAMNQAKSLAAEAAKTRKSLKQAFADRPDLRILMPPKFTWLTLANAAPSAQMPQQIPPERGDWHTHGRQGVHASRFRLDQAGRNRRGLQRPANHGLHHPIDGVQPFL